MQWEEKLSEIEIDGEKDMNDANTWEFDVSVSITEGTTNYYIPTIHLVINMFPALTFTVIMYTLYKVQFVAFNGR